MRWLISGVCSFGLGSGVSSLACAQLARAADKELQGTWTATKAERDGRAATDLIGHRLFFSGNRFESSRRTGSRSTRERSRWTRTRNRRRLTSSTQKVA